jgi:hypothetical protein
MGLAIGMLLVGTGPTITVVMALSVPLTPKLFNALEFVIPLLLTFGLLPNHFYPPLDLPVGYFQLPNLFLIFLLGITRIRLLAEREFRLRFTPLNLSLVSNPRLWCPRDPATLGKIQ